MKHCITLVFSFLLGCFFIKAQHLQVFIKPSVATGTTSIRDKPLENPRTGDLSRYRNYALGTNIGVAHQTQVLGEFRLWDRLGFITGLGINFYQMRFIFGSQENLREWGRLKNQPHLEIPLHIQYYQPSHKNGAYGLKVGAGITGAFYDFTSSASSLNNQTNALVMELRLPDQALFTYHFELGWYTKLNDWSELHFDFRGMLGWNKNLLADVSYYDIPQDLLDGLFVDLLALREQEPVFTESFNLILNQLSVSVTYAVRLWKRD